MDITEENELKETYTSQLKKVFGTHTFRENVYPLVEARITHARQNLTLNSDHREILHAIQEFQRDQSPYWNFRESIFGKALVCSLENVILKPNFDYIGSIYKKHYMIRMNLITSQYDARFDSSEWLSFTNEKKSEYIALKKRINLLKLDTVCNLREMISKISGLNFDIHNIVYHYCCENISEYLNLRSDIEDYRNRLKLS